MTGSYGTNPLAQLLTPPVDMAESWRWGTIQSVTPLRVRLDGDTEALTGTPDTLTPVHLGDRVRVHVYNRRATIIGVNGGGGLGAYPVGSFYFSSDPTSPQMLFGGVWEQVKGRFLYAADGKHPAGSTGGEETHTLTSAEMPAHNNMPPFLAAYCWHRIK